MGYDAIIIGSGLSGLAAGIRLAMFNKKVCIVEKHTVLGGLNSYYVRKNRTFDYKEPYFNRHAQLPYNVLR